MFDEMADELVDVVALDWIDPEITASHPQRSMSEPGSR
jgi:hypothetical protein